MQYELDNRADLKRQLAVLDLEHDERRAFERAAVDGLLRTQERLLELAVRYGKNASHEDAAGRYEVAEVYRKHSRDLLDVRAGLSTQDLVTSERDLIK